MRVHRSPRTESQPPPTARPKTVVVLPAFNEADNLPVLMKGLTATLAGAGLRYEVIVADDGSTDHTADIVRSFVAASPVRLVSHSRNLGLARAMDTGLRAALRQTAPGDVIVTMDADNTHPPRLIPRMVEAIAGGADLVIASRYAPGGREDGVPLVRRLLSQAIGLMMMLRFGLRGVRDYSSGYRAYRADLLEEAARRYGAHLIEARGFTVMAELLVKLQPLGPRVVEVPLHLRYDLKRGRSKLHLLRTVTDYLVLLLSRRPCLL